MEKKQFLIAYNLFSEQNRANIPFTADISYSDHFDISFKVVAQLDSK